MMLSIEDEKLLVTFCKWRCDADACVDIGLVTSYAHELGHASGRAEATSPPPSRTWIDLFSESNPEITLRDGQRVSEARSD